MSERIRKYKKLYYNPETDRIPDLGQFNNKVSYVFNPKKELIGIKAEDSNMDEAEFILFCNLIRKKIMDAREKQITHYNDDYICEDVRKIKMHKKEKGYSTYSDAHRRCYARRKAAIEEKKKDMQIIRDLFSNLPFFNCKFF